MGSNTYLNSLDGVHPLGYTPFDVVYTVGAAGALTAVRNGGITSVTRNGAGDYTFVLDAKYVDVYNPQPAVRGTFTRTDGVTGWCYAVGTDATTGFTSISVAFYPDNGASTTKTDILSGNTLCMTFATKALAAGLTGGP